MKKKQKKQKTKHKKKTTWLNLKRRTYKYCTLWGQGPKFVYWALDPI